MIEVSEASGRPSFGLLLLNWNDHRNVVDCAESLLQNAPDRAQLYVIDNRSRPNSIHYVRTRLPAAILIENGRNLGFCGGFNVGIRRAVEDDVDTAGLLNCEL